MNYKHIKSKENKSFSLVVVHPSKKIKQIKINKWIPIFIFLIFTTSLTGFIYYTYNLYNEFNDLKKDYAHKESNLNIISKLNNEQALEIDTLMKTTEEIRFKLNEITALQEKVKDMVGLDNTIENDTNAINNENADISSQEMPEPLSRSVYSSVSNNFLNIQMDYLSTKLDESEVQLTHLIDDVDSRLKYLEAKPNLMPTQGRITSKYGWRKNPFGSGKEFHYGLDIANDYGTKIRAAGKGVVTYSGYSGGFGKIIIISHGYGYESVYGHNKTLYVKVGDKVEKGQLISLMGNTGRSTGPHVHFEVRYFGERINPATIINNTK